MALKDHKTFEKYAYRSSSPSTAIMSNPAPSNSPYLEDALTELAAKFGIGSKVDGETLMKVYNTPAFSASLKVDTMGKGNANSISAWKFLIGDDVGASQYFKFVKRSPNCLHFGGRGAKRFVAPASPSPMRRGAMDAIDDDEFSLASQPAIANNSPQTRSTRKRARTASTSTKWTAKAKNDADDTIADIDDMIVNFKDGKTFLHNVGHHLLALHKAYKGIKNKLEAVTDQNGQHVATISSLKDQLEEARAENKRIRENDPSGGDNSNVAYFGGENGIDVAPFYFNCEEHEGEHAAALDRFGKCKEFISWDNVNDFVKQYRKDHPDEAPALPPSSAASSKGKGKGKKKKKKKTVPIATPMEIGDEDLS